MPSTSLGSHFGETAVPLAHVSSALATSALFRARFVGYFDRSRGKVFLAWPKTAAETCQVRLL